MKKLVITRATVIENNMQVHTYKDLNETVSPDGLEAYKEEIKARYAEDVRNMDVDLVYKEIDA